MPTERPPEQRFYDMSMTPSARRFGDWPLLVNTPLLAWSETSSFPAAPKKSCATRTSPRCTPT
jgi:hypothetical protein